jgi:uncharacterized membrane protein
MRLLDRDRARGAMELDIGTELDTGRDTGAQDAAWGTPAPREPSWPATMTVLAILGLYMALPEELTFGPTGIVPALALALLAPLTLARRQGRHTGLRQWRVAALTLIAVINAANVGSLGLLVRALLRGGTVHGVKVVGGQLLLAAVAIWLTNALVFALWYWELDRGGPDARRRPRHRQPDFLFPQMVTPACAGPRWAPGFVDYLYVSFTNATAFSPTDTMPLTPWAKMLLLLQALASLLTVALVAARAVNILP